LLIDSVKSPEEKEAKPVPAIRSITNSSVKVAGLLGSVGKKIESYTLCGMMGRPGGVFEPGVFRCAVLPITCSVAAPICEVRRSSTESVRKRSPAAQVLDASWGPMGAV
jgi:hypothetical protein